MGVNEQLILMVGCDVGYDTFDKNGGFDKFEKLSIDEDGKENTNRMAVISDGMSGDYCMVGIPIYVSGRYEHFSDLSNNKEHNGFGMKGLIPPTKEQINEIQKFVKDNFGIDNAEIRNCIFVHYTQPSAIQSFAHAK